MSFSPEKALQFRLIMLSGDEEALRKRALDDLLKAAEVAKDDFELETLAADSSTPMEWFASVSTAPFLGNRRTTIVRHLLRCDVDKLKSADFSKLPETALLILVADEESGGDDRQRTLKTVRTKWAKAVKDAKGIEYSFDPNAKEALDGVKKEVARLGRKISEPAANALVEMTGGSLSRAIDELSKLVLFLGEQEAIREADVREVVVASREWNVYRMVDSVFNGQIPEAIRQLRVLVGSQTKAEEAAFQRILPNVSRQLRLIWQARICVEANVGPNQLNSEVGKMFPAKNSITAEQPYRVTSLMNSARGLSLQQIQRCFGILADTDARLKGSLNSFNTMETLERMLLDMASIVAPPNRLR